MARHLFVANSGNGSVSVADAGTRSVVATVAVGGEPVDVAIAPDGTRAYVANKGNNSVAVIETKTNAQVATIAVGKEPMGVAVSPDGHRVYVSNFGDDTVSVIDTGSNAVVGAPIAVGKEPDGAAVSPDGSRLLVAQRGGNVSVIDTGTNALVGSAADLLGPSRLAVVPDGGRAFVTNSASTSVTAFSPLNGSLAGGPIFIGTQPAGIAIVPSGQAAYVAGPLDGTITPLDTSSNAPLSAPIGGFPGATGIAIGPDGLQGYVTDGAGSTVSIFDLATNVPIGAIPVGTKPVGIAVVPDQGPRASLFVSPARKRAKKAVAFHGSGSLDPDGKIATYAWDFGDGVRLEGGQETRFHRYRKPGEYLVTLKVTDEEGCSTGFVYTGQTASCHGSPLAVASSTISVGDTSGPILRLAGAKTQRLGGRIGVRARCPREPCALRAHGVLVTTSALNVRGKPRGKRLGTAQALRPTRGWRTLRLRVPAGARRAALRSLALGGEVKAKVVVIARDDDDELRLQQRKIELLAP